MGLMQRTKGARNERGLVMHLRLNGYDARRVIRTRAVSGYEGDIVPDVIATKNGKEYTFECKSSKTIYKAVYELYYRERQDEVVKFTLGQDGPYVAMSTNFELINGPGSHYFTLLDTARGVSKTLGLQKLLKGAQFLALKQNNKPFLFLRFWK